MSVFHDAFDLSHITLGLGQWFHSQFGHMNIKK